MRGWSPQQRFTQLRKAARSGKKVQMGPNGEILRWGGCDETNTIETAE